MSLRIIAPPKSPAEGVELNGESYSAPPATAKSSDYDDYLGRLVKLVPAESISAYPLLSTLAKDQSGDWALILVAWLLLAVTVVLRWKSTAKGEASGAGSPQWLAIAIAACSFVIWVNVMEGHFGVTALLSASGFGDAAVWVGGAKPFLAIVALVIWTILVPVFYQGNPPKTPEPVA